VSNKNELTWNNLFYLLTNLEKLDFVSQLYLFC